LAASENPGTDLFGEPVTLPKEGRGRPAISWDRVTANRVLLCFVRGWTLKKTAVHIGLSVPTLRKVYFSEVAKRTSAAERMEMRQLERLNDQAEGGNVGAEKELARRIEALRMRDASAKYAAEPKAKRPPKLGKKDQRKLAARHAGAGDQDWGELLVPGDAAAH
jgi:hypothetical protein